MIRILAILLLTCNFAIAQISQQTIVDEITANLPTNNRNEISAELLRNTLNQMTSAIFQNQGLSGFTITGIPTIGQAIIATSSSTASWQSIGGGQVTTITSADGSLLISPTTGNVVGSLNVGHANTWLALQNFSAGGTSLTLSSIDNSTNIATTAFVQTVVSTSAPSTLTFALPLTLANAIIPASVSSARVTAMANSGTSTCGLNFNKGNSTPTGQYQEILNVPSGIYWEPSFENSPVKACQFGTVADGTFNQTNNAVTGTDNKPMIQAAIDYAQCPVQGSSSCLSAVNKTSTVCLTDGNYRIDDTVSLGYGGPGQVQVISLTACNGARGSYFFLQGVTILPTKIDRCALNIQGGRHTLVKSVSFGGQNYVWGSTRSAPANVPVSTVDSGWLDPVLVKSGVNPGGLQRFSPYAAICYDGLSGTAPTAPYPAITYPGWTGIATQYGKAVSSDILIDDVQIVGFAVGIAQAPNSPTGDGNGDFLKVWKLDCQYTVYCVSIGGSQSRGVEVIDGAINGVYTFLTNTTNGTLSGELGGPFTNIILGNSYQFFKITGALGPPMIFRNLYSESSVRIGTVSPASAFSSDLIIDGCLINTGEFNTGVIPASLIDLTGTAMNATINACSISNGSRLSVLMQGSGSDSLTINGGQWQMAKQAGTLYNSSAVQQAVNYTGSMFAGTFQVFPTSGMGQLKILNRVTGAQMTTAGGLTNASTQLGEYIQSSGTRVPSTQTMIGLFDNFLQQKNDFATGSIGGLISFAGSPTVVPPGGGPNWNGTCETMTFSYLNTLETNVGNLASSVQLGDIIYHQNTSTLFVATAIGAPVTGIITALGAITAGSGYVTGTYTNVPLTGGTGTGAQATIVISGGGAVTSVVITAMGAGGYTGGDTLSASNTNLGGSGTGFSVPVSTIGAFVPITTRQQNNMTVTANVATQTCVTNTVSDLTLAGNSSIVHTGVTIPMIIFYGDFASGSTSVTNITRGDTFAGNLTSYLSNGDTIWNPSLTDYTIFNSPIALGSTLSAVTNGSPGSLTLSQAATMSGRFPIYPVTLKRGGIVTNAIAAKPTPSASGGTCAAAGAQTGNQVRGTVALSGACVATNTVTLTFVIHATTGWFCTMNDQTAPTILLPQTSTSATTAVFTAQGTSGASDILGFECAPY